MFSGRTIRKRFSAVFFAGLLVLAGALSVQAQNLVRNGDFETGAFAPWTMFVTPGGDISDTFMTVPAIVQFDTSGSGSASRAAAFSVGRDRFDGQPGLQGGGVYQQFFLANSSALQLSLSVAAWYDFPVGGNGDGGIFQLLLDGTLLDTWSSGTLLAGQTKRHTLGAFVTNASAGIHELRISILRNFDQADNTYQYIDNVTVIAVPEPRAIPLAAVSALTLTIGVRLLQKRSIAVSG